MRGDSASFDGYLVADEPATREKAYAWSTAIGLQQVDGLSPSKYLIKTAKRHIEGEITQAEARKLVDDYYETKEGHDLPDDVKEADKVDYGIAAANALAPMRRGMSKAAGNSGLKCGLKSGLKNEKAILSLVRGNSKVTIAEMVESTGLSRNGVKKIIARLKASGCLCRVGPDKGGHWEVLFT